MADIALRWADVAAAGGIREWVDAEIARQGLDRSGRDLDESDPEKKNYKARRDEERKVRKELYAARGLSYKQSHIVHLGAGVFWHDTADVDRFDADDPERERQDNALPALPDVDRFAKADGPRRSRSCAGSRFIATSIRARTITAGCAEARRLAAADLGAEAGSQGGPALDRARDHRALAGPRRRARLPRRSLDRRRTPACTPVRASLVKMDIKGFYPTVTARRVKGLLRRAGLAEQARDADRAARAPNRRAKKSSRTARRTTSRPAAIVAARRADEPVDHERVVPAARLPAIRARGEARLPLHALRRRPHVLVARPETPISVRLLRAVTMIVQAEGFTIHPKKTRVMRSGARQRVTGLIVNTPRVARRHACRARRCDISAPRSRIASSAGPARARRLEQLKGMAAFVMMTDRERGKAFMERIDRLIASREAKP